MKMIRKPLSLLCLLSALLCFWSCSGKTHPLACLAEELSFTAHLSLGGEVYLAQIHVSALEGEKRDATLTLLSPSSVSGVVFKKQGDNTSACLGEHTAELTSNDIFSFLDLLHVTLPLKDAVRYGKETTYLFSDGDTTYTAVIRDGARLPSRITREGDQNALSIEILP